MLGRLRQDAGALGGRLFAVLVLLLVLVLYGTATRPLVAITITEIMYHPSGADEVEVGNRNLEWIELYNDNPTVLNLSGYYFSNGISFVFPFDTYLEGRAYLVVCADEAAVRQKYGITNTLGNFAGRLDNDGETVELNIYGGGPEVRVKYGDRNQWPHSADGTGHSLVLKNVHLDPDNNDNWTRSTVLGGTPGGPNFDEPTIIDTTIVDIGDTWRYRKGTAAYPTGWQNVGFNDAGWTSGATGIGYGDGDDATVLGDMQNGYLSFAARRLVNLTRAQIDSLEDLVLDITYDDGFVFYVNGTEVARGSLGPPGTPVAYNATASSHEASSPESFALSRSLLRVGQNVFAAQVHNTSLGSSDASFIPRIVSRRERVPVVINEAQFRGLPGEGWLELHNTSGAPFDLSGFHVSDDRNFLGKYPLPAGSSVPARGFLLITEAESGLRFSGEVVSYYLSRPNLDEVVDAQLFETPPMHEPPLDGTSQARLPDGAGRFHVSTTPTPGADNQVDLETRVVINEIFYNPPVDQNLTPEKLTDLEFVELHNPTDEPVPLGGFRFTRGIDYEFLPGAVLPARGYLVVAAVPDDVEIAHSIAGVLGPYTGVLSQSGELLRIVDPLGNIADEVRYFDGGRWSRWADGGGSSLELLDPLADNSVASAWEASDESSKSRWEDVRFTINYARQNESEFQIRMLTPTECLIDEITVTRGNTQYIRNGTFDDPDPQDPRRVPTWIIKGNHIQSHRTTEETFAGAGALKVIATGDGDTRVNRIETETSFAMTSGTYTVDLKARWLRGGNLMYFSGFTQPAQFQKTYWMTYPTNLGSPGRRNSVAVDNLGPVISDVRHTPAVPGGGQTTTVLARVSDADDVATVDARYRLGTPSGAYSSAPLFDDGAHSDGATGDGLYGGTIPGQARGSRVVFYIEAADSLGARRTFPRTAPGRTLVYQHDSPLTARAAFTYRLVHDDTAWNRLNTRKLHSNELLDATFIFDESTVYYNVGTRYRGSPWNRPGNPRMYRLKFNKDDRYRRLSKVNISRYGNQQRERAAYYSVWRNSTPSTASPMSRSAFIRFRSRAGTWTMEHLEPVSRDYLNLWFPDDSDGILMKITGRQVFDDSGDNHLSGLLRWASYQYKGGNKAAYRWNFNLRTRELEDDFGPLISLMQTVGGNNATLDNRLEDIMDVEQFLRVYAARCAHDDWDTISIGNGQNAYFYFAPVEGRWKLLPWDMDHSWGNTGARIYPDGDSRFRNVINRPKYRRMYLGILNEMVNGRGNQPGFWSVPEMVRKVLDRNSAVVGSDGVGGSGSIAGFINARRGSLAAQVPRRVAFSITTNSGNDLTVDRGSTTIAGNGWVDVHLILVDGQPTALTWPSTTRWQTRVELNGGLNELQFRAFDVDGNLVGADVINVTSTFGWAAPGITGRTPAEARPGELVTVEGTEFHDGIEVFFSGIPATEVQFDENADPGRLTARVPMLPPGAAQLTVRNVDNRASAPAGFTVLPLPPQFIRGDVNLDRIVDISDPIRLLGFLFGGLEAPCLDAGDADNDETLALTDAIIVLHYVFLEGPAPAQPHPQPGDDPDGEGPLDCQEGVDLF